MSYNHKAINKNAKGNVNTRKIEWLHRNSKRIRTRPVIGDIYNLKTFVMKRNRKFRIFSNVSKPFICFEKIHNAFDDLPEKYDYLFDDYEHDIIVYVCHTKNKKKEDFCFDGKMIFNEICNGRLNTTTASRLLVITDDTFSVDDDGKFGYLKESCNSQTGKWNRDIFKLFFGEPEIEKHHYAFTYDENKHNQYITEFLILHELGHLYAYDLDIKRIGIEKRDLNYSHIAEEAKANRFAMTINPKLKKIFEKDISEILK
jgi:hypothetical protein